MRVKLLVSIALMIALLSGACGALEPIFFASENTNINPGGPVRDLQIRPSELRPDDPGDFWYYGGVQVDSWPSPQGFARVWYALEGSHAPPGADANANGVPDYVEYVAETADELDEFARRDGWRSLVEEASVMDDPGLYGGDERLDIYLADFGTSGDGAYRSDACRAGSNPALQVCAGHLLLENDFAGFGYPSPQAAARLVLSHEFFHALQAAYRHEYPGWWSEGSATWFEEHFDSSQDDFERLTRHYFNAPHRPLDDRQRGPFDSFAYGASIFVYFLAETTGVGSIQAIMERTAREDRPVIDAIRAELDAQDQPFEDVFQRFAVFNALTGERAVRRHGYPDAQRFAQVDLQPLDANRALDWQVQVDRLAARYALLSFERPVALSLAEIDGFSGNLDVALIDQDEFETSGNIMTLEHAGVVTLLPEDSPAIVVISNAGGAADALTLRVRKGEGDVEVPDDEVPDDEAPHGETSDDETPDDETPDQIDDTHHLDDSGEENLDDSGQVGSGAIAAGGGGCASGSQTQPVSWLVGIAAGLLAVLQQRRRHSVR